MRSPRSAGFTLLEITVAAAILGILLAAVYGVFARTLEGKERAEAVADEDADVRATFSRIVRDLQDSVVRPPSPMQPTGGRRFPRPEMQNRVFGEDRPPPGGNLQTIFLGPNHSDAGTAFDEIAFTSFVRRPASLTASTTDLATVHYFTAPDPADPRRHGLFREVIPSLSGDTFDPEKPSAGHTNRILDDVGGLEFRFFDGKEWVQEWDSTRPGDFAPAPQAVEISLAVVRGRGDVEIYRTAIDLPMTGVRAPHAQPGGQATPAATPPPT